MCHPLLNTHLLSKLHTGFLLFGLHTLSTSNGTETRKYCNKIFRHFSYGSAQYDLSGLYVQQQQLLLLCCACRFSPPPYETFAAKSKKSDRKRLRAGPSNRKEDLTARPPVLPPPLLSVATDIVQEQRSRWLRSKHYT